MANWYERHILPKLIEKACGQPPMTELRSRYVPRARGKVLEIGIGSGLNLPHYGDAVTSITGVDPSAELNVMARARAAALNKPVDVIGVSGEALPADDASYDSIVCTWTLCSIPNPYRAVAEMRRVLKPGGELLFVEHGRADDPGIVKWQHRVEPLWKIIGGGCHLTRRADELLADAGFDVTERTTGYVPGPKIAAFMIHGVALAR
ncbi:MAG: class I SAM-dependent methyltransferase [Pseudomonadales bacterium]|nr:class I SAM-dependent methyltransferase [Pseudomonadales bacterium]MCP5183244.1 class I SAM-dependent methyltransferase [Pseudomonadales bacterium]